MVPRSHRLPRTEFRARGYRTLTTPFFSLKTKENALRVNRIGVIVGKSVTKLASQRNFLERQVKAALVTLPAQGLDIVTIVFPQAAQASRTEFRETLREALKKIS